MTELDPTMPWWSRTREAIDRQINGDAIVGTRYSWTTVGGDALEGTVIGTDSNVLIVRDDEGAEHAVEDGVPGAVEDINWNTSRNPFIGPQDQPGVVSPLERKKRKKPMTKAEALIEQVVSKKPLSEGMTVRDVEQYLSEMGVKARKLISVSKGVHVVFANPRDMKEVTYDMDFQDYSYDVVGPTAIVMTG